MDYQTPTTKSELYEVLRYISEYYNGRQGEYTPLELDDLELDKIVFSPKTDIELGAIAVQELQTKLYLDRKARQNEISEKLAKLAVLGASLDADHEANLAAIASDYDALEEKVRKEAVDRGIYNTDFVITKIAELAEAENGKILAENTAYQTKTAEYAAERTVLQSKLLNLDTELNAEYGYYEADKLRELKEKQEAYAVEVMKYNNQIEEKSVKYSNAKLQTQERLNLQFLEIVSKGLTEEQLISLGYYDEVTTVILTFYQTYSPQTAYNDFISDGKLMVYLGSYYESMALALRARINA